MYNILIMNDRHVTEIYQENTQPLVTSLPIKISSHTWVELEAKSGGWWTVVTSLVSVALPSTHHLSAF